MILKHGHKFVIKSANGKKTLGTYNTKAAAVKRLRAIEYFKHHPKK